MEFELKDMNRDQLIGYAKRQAQILNDLTDRVVNPPIVIQTDDKEFERRAETRKSRDAIEIGRLEEEINRLEQIVLERGLS